jgi:hypothetical protein
VLKLKKDQVAEKLTIIGKMRALPFIVTLLMILSSVSSTAETQQFAESEANFAMTELRKLSDSGVYESLSLAQILSYSTESGTFHDNTNLKLSLASPYFKSGKAVEEFEVMVLTHKDDGVKSLAIDEFPEMSESSVESFLVKKTIAKKAEREGAYRLLELDALLKRKSAADSPNTDDVRQLLRDLDSPEALSRRRRDSLDVQARLVDPYIAQERDLSTMPLDQLYDVSLGLGSSSSSRGGNEWTDFQVERATAVLDQALLSSE